MKEEVLAFYILAGLRYTLQNISLNDIQKPL